MAINKIILSHPYSGSLYAYFREQSTRRPSEEILSHPYYRTLYGKKFRDYTDFALTLTLLYPSIVIPPADAHLPPTKKSQSMGSYEYNNPELGLFSSWADRDEIRDEINKKVERDLNDKIVNQVLQRVPKHSKEQILHDTHIDIHLANKYQCPIICSGGRKQIITRLAELDSLEPEIINTSSLMMLQEYMNISGLLFHPKSLDVLYALKEDKDIRVYADGFVKIMHSFSKKRNIRKELLILIRESMNKAIIANNISGVFDVVSDFLSIIGLIPDLGSGIAEIASTGVSRLAGKIGTKQEWFQFGPEIKKALSLSSIDIAISEELKKLENEK